MTSSISASGLILILCLIFPLFTILLGTLWLLEAIFPDESTIYQAPAPKKEVRYHESFRVRAKVRSMWAYKEIQKGEETVGEDIRDSEILLPEMSEQIRLDRTDFDSTGR